MKQCNIICYLTHLKEKSIIDPRRVSSWAFLNQVFTTGRGTTGYTIGASRRELINNNMWTGTGPEPRAMGIIEIKQPTFDLVAMTKGMAVRGGQVDAMEDLAHAMAPSTISAGRDYGPVARRFIVERRRPALIHGRVLQIYRVSDGRVSSFLRSDNYVQAMWPSHINS